MGLASLLSYLSGAFGYALLLTVPILALLRCLGLSASWQRGALLLSTSFVVFLALSPFPDPAHLDCSEGGVALQLKPFAFLEAPGRLWSAKAPLGAWLTDLTITSTIMNVVFFALVGASVGTLTLRASPALLYGLALTVGIELSQFTGLYGLYPCRYRTVDIDDVMTNVTGVLIGALLVQWSRRNYEKYP